MREGLAAQPAADQSTISRVRPSGLSYGHPVEPLDHLRAAAPRPRTRGPRHVVQARRGLQDRARGARVDIEDARADLDVGLRGQVAHQRGGVEAVRLGHPDPVQARPARGRRPGRRPPGGCRSTSAASRAAPLPATTVTVPLSRSQGVSSWGRDPGPRRLRRGRGRRGPDRPGAFAAPGGPGVLPASRPWSRTSRAPVTASPSAVMRWGSGPRWPTSSATTPRGSGSWRRRTRPPASSCGTSPTPPARDARSTWSSPDGRRMSFYDPRHPAEMLPDGLLWARGVQRARHVHVSIMGWARARARRRGRRRGDHEHGPARLGRREPLPSRVRARRRHRLRLRVGAGRRAGRPDRRGADRDPARRPGPRRRGHGRRARQPRRRAGSTGGPRPGRLVHPGRPGRRLQRGRRQLRRGRSCEPPSGEVRGRTPPRRVLFGGAWACGTAGTHTSFIDAETLDALLESAG